MNTHYEIVNVINDKMLLNAESYEYHYVTREQGPLRPGFYVALWRGHTEASRFDEATQYLGPFNSRAEAQLSYHRVSPQIANDLRTRI